MPSSRQETVHRKLEGHHHRLAKTVRRMVRAGELCADGLVLLETARMVEDALGSGVPVPTVLYRAGTEPRLARLLENLPKETTVYAVTSKVFETLTTTETSAGILALAQEPRWREQDLFPAGAPPLILVLAGLQDPGNLGTILRAAEAFGASGVEGAAFRVGYAGIRGLMRRGMQVNREGAARSRERVLGVFREVEERMADGRRYLTGDRFTAADLTFAALAAPAVLPREYGWPLPPFEALTQAMQSEVRHFRDTVAGELALRLYREERSHVLAIGE